MKHTQKHSAFTLIELIIVIAIIAILAAAIFVSVDPAKRLNQSRNSRRSTDTTALLNATLKYQVDGLGIHAPSIAALITGNDTDYHVIAADTDTGVSTCTGSVADTNTAECPYLTNAAVDGGLELNYTNDTGYADPLGIDPDCISLQEISTAGYIGQIPIDPRIDEATALSDGVGYYIRKNSNNSIVFGACYPEGEGDGGTGTPPVIEAQR